MPPAGFEPAIPASEWPQTHALNCAATEIGQSKTPVRYNYVTASQMCPQTLCPYEAYFWMLTIMNMAMERNLILRLTQECNLYKIWISPIGLFFYSQRAKNSSSNKEISGHLRTRSIRTFTRDVITGRILSHTNPVHVLTSCYLYTAVTFDTTLLSAPRSLAVFFWLYKKSYIHHYHSPCVMYAQFISRHMQTDGRMDMKLISTFRDCTKSPQKYLRVTCPTYRKCSFLAHKI